MFSRTYLLAVLAAILLATAIAPAPQTPSITAEELVKKALAARGGAARIKAVQSEKITGTISFGPGLGGPFFVELKRPLKMHMEMNVQNQTIVRVYDGRGSGWMVNPFAEDKGPVAMSGGELKNITDESDFDGPLVDYQVKGNRVEYLGKDDIDGKPAEKLKLTVKSGEVRTYFLGCDHVSAAEVGGCQGDSRRGHADFIVLPGLSRRKRIEVRISGRLRIAERRADTTVDD